MKVADWAIPVSFAVGASLFWYFRLILPPTEMHAGSGDFYTQIYPMALRAADWIHKGHIPLWNPLQLCGQPFLASVLYGIFYPLNFPLLLLPTATALEVIAVLHLFVAGVFTYAYARTIGVTPFGAAAAGIVFMLSGFVASQALWFTPAVGAIVWLPVGFLAIERIFARQSLGGAALLACAVAMPVLAGWLQTWTYSMHATAAYAGVRLVMAALGAGERPVAFRSGCLLAMGFALGICLAAIQLLPSLELQRLGPRRPGGLSIQQSLSMGPVAPGRLLADAIDSTPGFPRQMYVGMLPLIIMPLSLLTRCGRRRVVFLWSLGIWSIAVAMTVYTPAFWLFRLLPGGAWFRVPWRMVFVYAFAAAVLSGIALDVFMRQVDADSGPRSRLAIGLVTGIAVLLVATVSLPMRSVVYLAAALVSLWALWLASAVSLRRGIGLALLGLLTGDLFFATRSPALHPFHDLTVYEQQHEAFDFISESQEFYRTYIHWSWPGNPALMPKQGTLRGIFSITDYEPLSLERYEKFYHRLDAHPLSDSDPNRTPFIGFLELSTTPAALRLLDLMSVRYIVTYPLDPAFRSGLASSGLPWHPAFSAGINKYMVYANDQVLPRAYVAHGWNIAQSGEEALQSIAAETFDRWRNVVIEPEGQVGDGLKAADIPITPARITYYQPTRIEVESDSTAPGYLVLTDTFYPGWKATVDNNDASIQRANFLFRAVQVPAGWHRITFTYDPLSFKIGAGLTLTVLVVFAAWLATLLVRSARREWAT